ncbi:hypothetical protein DFS33DRAFT_1387564 [Desarmillaria ectypa]|nr:hypothetical protein DFS33DRAFT_1387564 [Desarmillaria ectypa]
MTITEFAELQFQSATFLSQPSLRDLLLRLRTDQGAWSGFPVYFYMKDSEKVLYLISGWQNVPAHEEWIASDENQTLLKLFKPHVQITDFVHLDVEFGGILSAGEQRLRFWKNEGVAIDEKQWEVDGNDVEGNGKKYCFSHVGSDELSEGEIIQRVSL